MLNKYALILVVSLLSYGPIYPQEIPSGVKFDTSSIVRKGNFGDNWCQTWGLDDQVYTMLDDGNGWWGSEEKLEGLPDWEGSMLLQISGDKAFGSSEINKMPGWPVNLVNSPLYAYGILAVDSTMYVWVWKSETDTWYRRPVANRLVYTTDFGKSVFRWDGTREDHASYQQLDSTSFFFYKEDPRPKMGKEAYAFNWISFCQNGQANSSAKDEYIYMYSPEQYDPQHLSMIRVHKDDLLDKSKYEYFMRWEGNDRAVWTSDITQRGMNFRFPDASNGMEWMWSSWFPSVVYNKGLDLFIMTSYGVADPKRAYWDGWCWDCEFPGSIGFWYAKNPWGPWKQFYYSDFFYPDNPNNRTYGVKLSPKWMSKDGKKMVLVWSDAGGDHEPFYNWNQMDIEILTSEL